MLSCGMLTSLADSIAAFSRMLPFGSPLPFLAATVISRRILEKSLPRCTSALPFLRLICDHRECPDICRPLDGGPGWPPSPQIFGPPRRSRGGPRHRALFDRQCSLEALHSPETALAADQRGLPAPPLGLGARRERPGRSRAQIVAQVHVGDVGGARVAHLTRPRLLGQDLDADLERRGAHVVE